MRLPSLFYDGSDSIKIEETINYFISWTIRCADNIYQNENKKVYRNYRIIVSKLLGFDNADFLEFTNIKVCRNHKNIDLWAELNVNGEEYALVIENKMYSSNYLNQLDRYKRVVEEHYLDNPSRNLEYVLLQPNYELVNQDDPLVIFTDFTYCNLEQLTEFLELEKTGNQLFDEFWFNWALESHAFREKSRNKTALKDKFGKSIGFLGEFIKKGNTGKLKF